MSRPSKKRRRFKYIDDILVYSTTSDDITLAHKRSCELGVPYGSYSSGMGRMTGFLGEIAVGNYLPRSRYVGDKVYSHDLEYKNQTIEVKSKICGSRPAPHFSAFVNGDKDISPENDVYFFTRVRRDWQTVYICGWLPTPTFFDEAKFIPAGSSDDSGFVFKMSGFHIDISELNYPDEFK